MSCKQSNFSVIDSFLDSHRCIHMFKLILRHGSCNVGTSATAVGAALSNSQSERERNEQAK